MILVTGGAWQGKREYAYGLMQTDSDKKLIIEANRCSVEDMKRVQIVDQLHLWIRQKMEELLPQSSGSGFAGAAQAADGGWDERVFDQQEMLLAQENIWQALLEVIAENPDVIFIVNELGCGVIPMDVRDRRYRELVGRTCCDLAKEAKEVHRVVCGVGTVIKKTEVNKTGTNVVKTADDSKSTEEDEKEQTPANDAGDAQAEAGANAENKQTDSENTAKEK